ncbi:42453_t:CDS:1, partial [Gigaspora margarita]
NPQFQENLFGQSAFTSEWDEKFDIIIKQLINRHNKDFGIEEINSEILTIVRSGCQVNPPNVIILEPGPEPNSNESIF